jgi:sigma-B regulation protein RsbQ
MQKAQPTRSLLKRNNVRESGVADGRPIVFAHGYGCDQAMWRLMAPAFEPDHRVVLFDHVGFGGSQRSAWSREHYATLSSYADDLVELLESMDLTDVVFVGHSVSSMIGVLAAIQVPQRFAQLILIGPSPRYINDTDGGYVGGFSASDIEELIRTLDSNHLGWSQTMAPVIMGNSDRPELGAELTESFCRADPEVARSFARATFLSDNRHDLAKVTTPTLILQCSDDAIAPSVVGDYVHEHIATSQLRQLEATGHCPNLSAPDETVAAIRAYLSEHERH